MIYIDLFLTFFKIGLFTFGGGYAMIPMIQQQTLQKGWISVSQLVDFIAISESTPGPFAINIATFIGIKTAEMPGAICATLGVVLPSFIIILIIARYFNDFREKKMVKGALYGVRPVVVGLIAAIGINIGLSTIFPAFTNILALPAAVSSFEYKQLIIMIAALALSFSKKKLHPIITIGMCACLGLLLF